MENFVPLNSIYLLLLRVTANTSSHTDERVPERLKHKFKPNFTRKACQLGILFLALTIAAGDFVFVMAPELF